jgi:hypothetical protein
MLGININGEFLDLSPQTAAELVRSSPFFNTDDLAEEYSLPFTFPYTPKNARLLGLQNHFYTRRLKARVLAKLYDNNNFSYSGELIIEAADLNVNDITKSKISGYFLSGVSSFFQQVKNKKLKDLELGGVRQFVWTNNDPSSSNIGFWQTVHKSLEGNMEYSFSPIRNSKWSGSDEPGTPDWMNKPNDSGQIDYNDNFNTLAPQISLKYLLQKIFEEHGWDFDYSGMPEQQWESLFIPSFYAVTWQKIADDSNPPFFVFAPLQNISMNLQNHVPPEVYVQNFIIALRNRYNWGFDFDSTKKICKMIALKDLAYGAKKDFTKFMSVDWTSDFSEDKKIFGFKNEIDSNDALSSAPDFLKVTYGAPLERFEDLPAPTQNNFNLVIYCWKDNQYFQCRYNEDDHLFFWDLYADNIYSYSPVGENENMSTEASTMPVYKTLYRHNDNTNTDYYGLFPLCEQEGNWEGKSGDFIPWGIRLLFHRGMVWEANPAGNQGQVKYSYLTSICFTPTQVESDLDWSNVYVHDVDGVQKGIIEYWWTPTLKFLEQSEVQSGILNLPRQELVAYRWSDVILLKNIPFIGQKLTEVIPYDGTVKAELRRIG